MGKPQTRKGLGTYPTLLEWPDMAHVAPVRVWGIHTWRQVMDSSERWLSVKEVAALLSVSPDTVRRLVKRSELRALVIPVRGSRRRRIYQSLRISDSEVMRFIRVNMTGRAA